MILHVSAFGAQLQTIYGYLGEAGKDFLKTVDPSVRTRSVCDDTCIKFWIRLDVARIYIFDRKVKGFLVVVY